MYTHVLVVYSSDVHKTLCCWSGQCSIDLLTCAFDRSWDSVDITGLKRHKNGHLINANYFNC